MNFKLGHRYFITQVNWLIEHNLQHTSTILCLISKKRTLKLRLQEEQQRNAEMASTLDPSLKPTSSSMVVIYDVHNGDKRPANLVRSFGELYSVARLETLDDLDTIDELVDADELKNKLLFSVVVVSVV